MSRILTAAAVGSTATIAAFVLTAAYAAVVVTCGAALIWLMHTAGRDTIAAPVNPERI